MASATSDKTKNHTKKDKQKERKKHQPLMPKLKVQQDESGDQIPGVINVAALKQNIEAIAVNEAAKAKKEQQADKKK